MWWYKLVIVATREAYVGRCGLRPFLGKNARTPRIITKVKTVCGHGSSGRILATNQSQELQNNNTTNNVTS
jgi:hypothetical protein